MTEACTGRVGVLGEVQWYVVPNASTLDADGGRVHGYWVGSPDRIVLSDAHRLDGPLVRHEMLHALLQTAGHPRDSFLTACDGVVSCDGACASETGGRSLPTAAAPELSPGDLVTRTEIAPERPAESIDSGALAVTVSITNPRTEPVWVRLTPQAPGDPYSQTFGVVLDYDEPSRIGTSVYEWTAAARFPLGPRETRRYVWDGQLPAGRYGIRGYFNTDTATRVVLGVGP
jgi:hypothetical protein